MSSNAGSTLLALLTGVVIGAGFGILYAPDKGSRTREKINDGYDDAKNHLIQNYKNTTEELKHRFSVFKQNNLQDTYDDMLSHVSHKTEDVISFLESKLADLKEQNARLQK